MKYLSLFSGVEAASLAWMTLGWTPVAFAEFDAFPSAVLAHRFPDVPNLGDVTKINGEQFRGTVDLIVGGSPCQGFSVAGKQQGLNDPRSALALAYVRILGEVRPKWFVWENVPGVLSANGGADFRAFLRALEELGYHCAWRTLDAQYVRVDGYPGAIPQRRRRLFVVGHLTDWRCAAKVLFEQESLRGNSEKSERKGKETSKDAGGCALQPNCRSGSGGEGSDGVLTNVRSLGIDRAAFNQGENAKFGFTICEEQIPTMTARGPSAVCTTNDPNDRVTGTITADGDRGATLQQLASGVYAYDRPSQVYDMTHANDVIRECGDKVPTLQARMGTGGNQVPLVLDEPKFYNTALTYGTVTEGSVCKTLSAQMDNQTDLPIVLMDQGGSVMNIEVDRTGTLRAQTHGHEPIVIHQVDKNGDHPKVLFNTSARDASFTPDEKSGTITAGMRNLISLPLVVEDGEDAIESQDKDQPLVLQENGNDRTINENLSGPLRTTTIPKVCATEDPTICIRENTIGRAEKNGGNGLGVKEESAYTITTSGPHGVMTKARVRRLTPLECERLMGFPDEHTKVPYRGKPADKCPDAPRYKACGNSMCVNVMRWIGERIQMVEDGVLGNA